MDDGCVKLLLQKKNRNCFFLFYSSWFCCLETSHFKLYCSLLIQKLYSNGKHPIITNKGQDGLLDTKMYTWLKSLGYYSYCYWYFMQTPFHCCFNWYLYLLFLEFYILYYLLHKENYRLALKTIKIDVWLWTILVLVYSQEFNKNLKQQYNSMCLLHQHQLFNWTYVFFLCF